MNRKPVSEWTGKTATVCLTDWAEAYLDFSEIKFSGQVYEEKRSMFKRFFKEVNPLMDACDLKPATVLAYIMQQKKLRSGYAANKDRKNLVAGWNWGMKYMNPALPGPNPCLVERMPEIRKPRYIPPEEDFWKVYESAEGQDQIILLTFLYLAARRGEVFKLKWSDINFVDRRVRLETRKRKDGTLEYDWLPMAEDLRAALKWWWENRPIKESPNVFLCLDKYPFTEEFYGQPFQQRRHFMNRICQKAGVNEFGFHAIRHLSASILYNKGYEVSVIQAILRHKHPTTTDRYLKTLGHENLRNALEEGFSNPVNIIQFPQDERRKTVG